MGVKFILASLLVANNFFSLVFSYDVGLGRICHEDLNFGERELAMGGCCCSSRKSQLQGTPVYYYVSQLC